MTILSKTGSVITQYPVGFEIIKRKMQNANRYMQNEGNDRLVAPNYGEEEIILQFAF